jgi:hypothetical protein
VASWPHGTSVTFPTLITGELAHVVVPALRQRMKTWQVVSHDPTAFSRAVVSVTIVAPVVRPEQPVSRTATTTHAAAIAARRGLDRSCRLRSMRVTDGIPVGHSCATAFRGIILPPSSVRERAQWRRQPRP